VARASKGGSVLSAQSFSDIAAETKSARVSVGIDDLDNVLGGGILLGGVVLLAGQPGIGKSTLLLQVANNVATNVPTLYVSGEESTSQVKLRADRLGATAGEQLSFAASTSADDIAATIRSGAYKL